MYNASHREKEKKKGKQQTRIVHGIGEKVAGMDR